MTAWIFFDCFNTLIDDFDASGDESGLGSLPDLALELGVVQRRADFITAYASARPALAGPYVEVDLVRRIEHAVSGAGLEGGDLTRVVERLISRWHAEYPETLRLTPGVVDMLAYWRGKRRLGVVSNFHLAGYPASYLERFGIRDAFEFVIDSAAFGHRKPGRRIFEEALRTAGAQPEAVTFIGDRLDLDVEPSHALGMRAIHLNRSAARLNALRTPVGFASIAGWDEFR